MSMIDIPNGVTPNSAPARRNVNPSRKSTASRSSIAACETSGIGPDRTSGSRLRSGRRVLSSKVGAVPPLRAVIADDELLLREGVARVLEEAGIEVVGRAADAPELVRKVRGHKPDVAIIDVRMPPDLTDDGLRAAIEIRRTEPEVGVLVFSQHLVERFVTELVGEDARGVGYLLKHRIADLGYFT